MLRACKDACNLAASTACTPFELYAIMRPVLRRTQRIGSSRNAMRRPWPDLSAWTMRSATLCVHVPLGSAEQAYSKHGILCLPCEDKPFWHFVTLLWERGCMLCRYAITMPSWDTGWTSAGHCTGLRLRRNRSLLSVVARRCTATNGAPCCTLQQHRSRRLAVLAVHSAERNAARPLQFDRFS